MRLLVIITVIFASLQYADSIKSCKLDIVFCIDNSGSIGGFRTGGRFIKDWELVKSFAMDIISEMRISRTRTRVGLVDFGDMAYPEFDLKKYKTKPEVMKAVALLHYRGELTNTTGGLKEARIMLTDPKYGSRGDDVPKVILLITDGDPTVAESTLDEEVRNLRRDGILVIAVGVTKKVNTQIMLKIATSREDFFRVREFKDLEKIKNFVATDDLCEKRNISTLPPLTTVPTTTTTMIISTTEVPTTTTTVPTPEPIIITTTTEAPSTTDCKVDKSSESSESLESSESSNSSEDKSEERSDNDSKESSEFDSEESNESDESSEFDSEDSREIDSEGSSEFLSYESNEEYKSLESSDFDVSIHASSRGTDSYDRSHSHDETSEEIEDCHDEK